MTLDDECRLSFYNEIATLDEAHGVTIVQHTETARIYVKKKLVNYDMTVFQYLRDHPVHGIPRIYELIPQEHALIIIEEYISGTPLQEILKIKKTLPEQEAKDIICKLCMILRELHAVAPPIIHRDIKPSNIILTPDGNVRLLDMDAAKHVHREEAQDTMLLGTKGYAAPEQYGFGSSSIETDIYSLGVLYNVLLVGDFPRVKLAEGKNGAAIKRCTSMDPTDRFRTVDDLMRAIGVRTGTDFPEATDVEGWRRFLPPGFRTGNFSKMIFAVLGYFLLITASLNLIIKDASPQRVLLNQIAFFLIGMTMILFTGNYLDIWRKLKITRVRYRWLQVIIIMVINILILFVGVLILIIVEKLTIERI